MTSQQLSVPDPGLQTENLLDKSQPPRVYYSCGSALPFTAQVLPGMLQPSGAATWEAGSGLHEEASYLLRNCLWHLDHLERIWK